MALHRRDGLRWSLDAAGETQRLTDQHRMMLATARGDGGAAYGGHRRDRAAVFFQAEAAAGKNLFVAALVQIGETAGELDLRAVDRDRSPRSLAGSAHGLRYVVDVDREEPAHARVFVFQIAGGLLRRGKVDD